MQVNLAPFGKGEEDAKDAGRVCQDARGLSLQRPVREDAAGAERVHHPRPPDQTW